MEKGSYGVQGDMLLLLELISICFRLSVHHVCQCLEKNLHLMFVSVLNWTADSIKTRVVDTGVEREAVRWPFKLASCHVAHAPVGLSAEIRNTNINI